MTSCTLSSVILRGDNPSPPFPVLGVLSPEQGCCSITLGSWMEQDEAEAS